MILRDLVDALIPATCAACDGPSTVVEPLCARCAESVEPPPLGFIAACSFGGAVADAVRAAKFRPDEGVAEALARLWVARVQAGACPAVPDVDLVTFVPAPYRRRLKRGFDLPAVLAAALAQSIDVELLDALACTRVDEPLSFGADKATRAAKVSGRYRLRASVAGKRVLLVDDVRTTGATLNEAARVLEGADVVQAAFAVAP